MVFLSSYSCTAWVVDAVAGHTSGFVFTVTVVLLQKPGVPVAAGDEDADLAAAIAASMQDVQVPAGTAAGHPGAASTSGLSYAAAAAAQPGPAAHQPAVGHHEDFEVYDDEDPELAAALAASLEEHNQQQQPEDLQQQDTSQLQQQLLEVPEEPAEGADGVLTLAFRLPSGARLSRRFSKADSVAVVQSYVMQMLSSSGELKPRQQVHLSTQFPTKILDQVDQSLEAASLEDRSMLSVAIS